MGICHSISIDEEIPAYIQKGVRFDNMGSFFYLFFSSPSGTLMTDSAKFDDPKPQGLQVSDDTWASLRLRVDPLARAIIEPHRLYVGASLLCLLIGLALAAVRPDFKMQEYSDDDANVNYNHGYYADDAVDENLDDFWKNHDVDYNEWEYRNKAVAREKMFWNLGFAAFFLSVIVTTAIVGSMMESRNRRVDAFIKEVCGEICGRFEQEGWAIEYKTRNDTDGWFWGHFVPERAICFHELDEDDLRDRRSSAAYVPPDADPEKPKKAKKRKEAAFGSINVMVPDGYTAGQVVNVMTPSGLPIMVAVPNGILPGQSFAVQIPAQMYRPQK